MPPSRSLMHCGTAFQRLALPAQIGACADACGTSCEVEDERAVFVFGVPVAKVIDGHFE